ncbi:conserved protein, unknown function [Hepatocystis sp. ex Piliocolobus tephrosceles]|nr:conserved protein, unknown function [Hepatocystis sp. ex Piliocolobus tephrosceles]
MIKHVFKLKNYSTLIACFSKKKYAQPLNFISTKTNVNDSINKKKESKEKLNKESNATEDPWSILAFEKNISFFSVSFYIFLAIVLALHFYNNYNESTKVNKVDEAKAREMKNLMELEEKRKNL